ncbi:hypothetical protein [Thiofilum flexile]|uniref:hypothetical protein n=1 Tax=Thiofilum flexile TaxID=125627 RepID=UPI0003796135|nr:hypothetical protein [Thiofilum flexile]
MTTIMTQVQTEALVRLMLAARYQDKRLSLAEEETFKQLLNTLQWDSMKEIGLFAMRETAVVRNALISEAAFDSFINTQCAVLRNSDLKAQCMEMLEAVIKADGEDSRENVFLQKVSAALS